jgi:hypothetical protein
VIVASLADRVAALEAAAPDAWLQRPPIVVRVIDGTKHGGPLPDSRVIAARIGSITVLRKEREPMKRFTARAAKTANADAGAVPILLLQYSPCSSPARST